MWKFTLNCESKKVEDKTLNKLWADVRDRLTRIDSKTIGELKHFLGEQSSFNIEHWRICVTIKRLIITHVHDYTRIMIRKLLNLSVLRVFLFAVKLTIHHVHRKNCPKFMAIKCWWQISLTNVGDEKSCEQQHGSSFDPKWPKRNINDIFASQNIRNLMVKPCTKSVTRFINNWWLMIMFRIAQSVFKMIKSLTKRFQHGFSTDRAIRS